MKRRSFLAAVSSTTIAHAFAAPQSKRKVAVIGHTGRGNYGHGLDTVWKKIPETEIVAVADANAKGLSKELKKLSVEKGYADYRTMLNEVRPEFVSVCPRHADQHHDMALAAIEAGVKGLYVEKPFCRSPAEADSLITACEKHGATIAVAHRNRYHPALKQIDKLIESGQLGKLLSIRGRGKGDRRGGDEDLWVLGGHIFNLVQYFAGDPVSCSAIMLKDGRRVTAKDVRPGAEGLGPLAANEVHVRYETKKGVTAFYDSIANDGTTGKGYCMELIGSKGTVIWHIDADPVAHFVPGNPFTPRKEPQSWIPISTAGPGKPENRPDIVAGIHNHAIAVRDLIDACDNGRAPLCDIHAGATAVEMICGAFESHRQSGAIVDFPLKERRNSLSLL